MQTTLTNLQTSIQALTDPTLWGDQQQVSSSDTSHVTVTRTGGAAAGGYEIDGQPAGPRAAADAVDLDADARAPTGR